MLVTSSAVKTKPVGTLASETDNEESQCWHSRDWDAALGHLRERKLIGIDAAGQMTDCMLEDLSSIEHLLWIRPSGSRGVTDAGIRHIAKLSRMRHLHPSGTSATDRQLE